MGADEVKVVSPEQIDALMEKLGTVQTMLEEHQTNYEAFLKAIDEKEEDTKVPDVVKSLSVEDVTKAVADAIKPLKEELDEIKNTPFIKGVQDGDEPQQKAQVKKDSNASDLTKSVKLAYGVV